MLHTLSPSSNENAAGGFFQQSLMGNGMMADGMGGWMLLNMVVSFLLFLGIVLLVAWAVQWARKSGLGKTEDSALETLKKRYARGEISKAEFEEKKRDMS
jgi:putative membrane protein